MERPRPGDYWKRTYYDIDIYGYAMTLAEIEAEERSLGSSGEELVYTMNRIKARLDAGFVWGKGYSVACPEGEYGSTPARQAIKISKGAFDRARAAEWKD